MSGGADSSAAALLLKQNGFSVVGITMAVDHCNASLVTDTKEVAKFLNINHYVTDLSIEFTNQVIDPFVTAYMSGYTPNPCVMCNRAMKFSALRQRAVEFGCSHVATGHYARIKEKNSEQNVPKVYGLYTACDVTKDQSYFLYTLTQKDLAYTLFPIGEMTKGEVRELLSSHALPVANKEESQDICFVPNASVSDFIEKRNTHPIQNGTIVDTQGCALGKHVGIHRYTIGQRKGLGIASSDPLYVIDINSTSNTVTVGRKHELERSSFFVGYVNWVSGEIPNMPFQCLTKLRYRNAGVVCQIIPVTNDMVCVTFTGEWSSVSPGQAAVFYADADCNGMREVLGGGIILKDQERVAWLERAMH